MLTILDLLFDLLVCAIVTELCVVGWMWIERRTRRPDIDLSALFDEEIGDE